MGSPCFSHKATNYSTSMRSISAQSQRFCKVHKVKMKITINGRDYTSALDAAHPLTIARTLNEPSTCQLWLSLPANSGVATPSRNQPIAITGDDGTCYFTGYIAACPMPEYAGFGMEGPRYRIAIQAISDELLLD